MSGPDVVERIARAVLYEGYVLWPYRRSAAKNQRRWTFGGVYPRAFSEGAGTGDPWRMQTQCLVQGREPRVSVEARFLHVVDRKLGRKRGDGSLDLVDELRVGSERYLAWDEATERRVDLGRFSVADLATGARIKLVVPAGEAQEPIVGPSGREEGVFLRSWRALSGGAELMAERVAPELFRLTVRLTNTTPWQGGDREQALRQTFVSMHTALQIEDGAFASLTDPPAEVEPFVATCESLHTWPVLVGEIGDRHLMLSSPIILPDYPQVAPESQGDLFDGAEIDQLLLLNVLALTDEEKDEVRATDPRTREILERAESMTAEDFLRLHGAIRDLRILRSEESPVPSVFALDRRAARDVSVRGITVAPGSTVRLRPRPGGDIFDIALAGKLARVEAIEQDYDQTLHIAVTVLDDPGRDLGQERQIGHRFFFRLDEIEPVDGE